MKYIFQEYQAVNTFLRKNYHEIVILGLATLSVVMQWYRPVGPNQATNQLFYYVVLPIISIVFLLKKNPLDYGFRLGNYRVWLTYVFLTILIGFPILYISSRFVSVSRYYFAHSFDYYEFLTISVPVLFAWEYFLRGFILFGLEKKLGDASIVIQMVPFVLLHLGKPEIEALSCIVTGLWFGWIAYRGKSFWPAFVIHMFINFTVRYFVAI